MGGADVLAYAVRNPGSTGSIVVSNSYAGVADPGYRTILDRIWATEVLRLPAHLLELSPALRGRQPERVAEWLRIHDDAAAGAEDDVAFRVPLDQLSGLTQPVLIIAGDADLLAPPALMRTLHEHIPGSRFAVIPETGHASAFESPEAWNSEVLGFLEMADRRD